MKYSVIIYKFEAVHKANFATMEEAQEFYNKNVNDKDVEKIFIMHNKE